MAEIGEITAKLTADVDSFTAGMGRANTSLQNFQNAASTATSGTKTFYEGVAQAGEYASGSERGVRRMELALGSLTSEAFGANHAVGMLGEGLLLFGGGTALTIGTLAGLAAIAAAIELMGAGTKKATEQLEAMGKEMDKIGPHGKLMEEQFKLDKMKADLEETKNRIGDWGMEIRDFYADLFGFNTSAEQIAAQQERVNAAAREYNKFLDHRQELDLEHRLAMDEFIARVSRQVELEGDNIAHLMEKKEIVDGLNDAYQQMLQLTQGDVAAGVFGSQLRAGGIGLEEIDKGVSQAVDRAQRELDKDLRETERQAKEWGQRISTALVDGITGKLDSLGSLMKSILEAWINKFVITPFLVNLGIFSPSAFGEYVGEMVGLGVGRGMAKAELGPMGLNLNLNVKKSGGTNPFDVARDADWQAAFRETALVSHSQGFRLPGQT